MIRTLGTNLCLRIVRAAGSRLAIFGIVVISLGAMATAPRTIVSHAGASPFAVDYLAFDSAGALVREHRAGELYEVAAQRSEQSLRSGAVDDRGAKYFEFLYPPIVAAAFAPLSSLSVAQGYVAFTALLILALTAAMMMVSRITRDIATSDKSVLLVCSLGSSATCVSLFVGQITPLLLLAALGALVAMRSSKPIIGGLLLGLLCVKPHFVIVALVLALAARQRRLAAIIFVTAAALAVASVAIAGADGVRGYVDLTRDVARDPALLGNSLRAEQNLFGLAATVLAVKGGGLLVATQALVGLGAAVLVVRAIRTTEYAGEERLIYGFALGALLVLVASPHVQYYDLGLLVLPAIFVVRRRHLAVKPELKRGLGGLLVLSVVFIEMAAILASLNMSISAPFLSIMLVSLCEWRRVEDFLAQTTLPALPATMTARLEPVA